MVVGSIAYSLRHGVIEEADEKMGGSKQKSPELTESVAVSEAIEELTAAMVLSTVEIVAEYAEVVFSMDASVEV